MEPDSWSVPGLAAEAASLGWNALGEQPFDSPRAEYIHDVTRALYDVPSGTTITNLKVGDTFFRDAHAATVDDHAAIVANAWTSLTEVSGVAVCILRTSLLVPPVWIDRKSRHGLPGVLREVKNIATGAGDFDAGFVVHGAEAVTNELLSSTIRSLLLQRDDWSFEVAGNQIVCVCREPYASLNDMQSRVRDLITIANALSPALVAKYAHEFPTLPDGTVLDPNNPEAFDEAIRNLDPAQLEAFKAQVAQRKADHQAERERRRH